MHGAIRVKPFARVRMAEGLRECRMHGAIRLKPFAKVRMAEGLRECECTEQSG